MRQAKESERECVMRIYLASPFFNEAEIKNIERAEKILRGRGFELFSPREHSVTDEKEGTSKWSEKTFIMDLENIDLCDVVVMLYYGNYSDSGTAWECGYAYGTGKPVVVVHFGDSSNLMVHQGSKTNITLDELESYDFDTMPVKEYCGKMF